MHGWSGVQRRMERLIWEESGEGEGKGDVSYLHGSFAGKTSSTENDLEGMLEPPYQMLCEKKIVAR